MKRRNIVTAALILAASLAFTTRTYALFGIGDIVFDPSNYAESVKQLVQMEQQYTQLVRSYQMLRSQYDHVVWMARRVPVNMATRYRTLATPWRRFAASNTYGTTESWVSGVNTGQAVSTGYLAAIERLRRYGAGLTNMPPDQLERLQKGYGTVELTDGANLNALEIVGRLRANAPSVESVIERLEDDSLSSDPEMNTQIAVLNKINAAHLVTIRSSQDTNKLLVALAEHQVLEAKRLRDAEARGINQHVRFVAEGRAVLAAQAAGASHAMRGWRMP